MPETTTTTDTINTTRPAPPLRSPFEGRAPFESRSRSGQLGVLLRAETLASVVQVSTWPAGIDALCAALRQAVAELPPRAAGQAAATPAGLLVRTGPEEFLLVCEQAREQVAAVRRHVTSDIGSVTDLSHARCRIHISGDNCLDTLAKLYAIDFRAPAFPLGQTRLTGHHHVPCLLHRLDADAFDVYVFTTYALDQLATLIDAALEYGVALR